MTILYLIRHCETAWNREKRYQGLTDIPLSEIGLAQAERLSERFKNIPVDKIFVSPLGRAVKTAEYIKKYNPECDILIRDGLKEICFGEWEGKTVDFLKKSGCDIYSEFLKNPFNVNIPNGESFSHVKDRINSCIKEIILENKDKKIAIVSHGAILRLAVMSIMDFDETFYRKTWLNNSSITEIHLSDTKKLLLRLNDFSHIDDL